MAESFTDHPRQYVQIVAGPNNGQKTSAAGRYQYLERSWDEASKALGLPDFSPTSQDKAAFWDAQRIYRAKTGRNLVTDIREAEGDPEKLEDIGRGISGWWTSLPDGVEPNEATASFGERFSQNLLYYKDLFRTTVGTGVMTTRKIVSVRSGPPAPDAASARPNWRLSISGSSDLLTEEVLRNAKLAASGPPELRSSQKRWATKSDKIVTGETTHSNESRRLIKTRADVHRGQASTPQITNLVPLPKKRRGAGIDPEAGSARDATLAIPVRAAETARNRGWVLSGIVGGKAFLKDANKFLIVERGDVVPGAGKVTDILRWGNRWIVATDKGLILTR